MHRVLRVLLFALGLAARPAVAIDPGLVKRRAVGERDGKVAGVGVLGAWGDEGAPEVIQAPADGTVETAGKRVLIVTGDEGVDAVTGEKIRPLPEGREDVVVNNRLRREIDSALGALRLVSLDRGTRLKAAKALEDRADASLLPLVRKALARESDPAIKPMLELIAASIELKSGDRAARLAAVRTLGQSGNPATKTLLLSLLAKKDGTDPEIRAAAESRLRAVEKRLVWGERLGRPVDGGGLGSILLLAALGLAITYALMGVFNMAPAELIMFAPYPTSAVQNLFPAHAPGAFDAYLPRPVPAAFLP